MYVRAFLPPSASSSGPASQGGKWQVSNNGGEGPRWSRTGHELVYLSGDQLMSVSYAVSGTTFVADKPRVWMISPFGITSRVLQRCDWHAADPRSRRGRPKHL